MDATYDDPRTGERVHIREHESPSNYIDNEYDRQLAPVKYSYDHHYGSDSRSALTTRNLQDYDRHARRRSEDYDYDDRPRRRRRSSSRSTNSSPDRYRSYDRRRDDRRDRRPHSLGTDRPRNGNFDQKAGDFVDKNFDQSFDGLLAAAAGAGLGAVASHRLGKSDRDRARGSSKDDTWKTVGSSVAGAALGNAAEKRYRQWREEKGNKNMEDRRRRHYD